MPPTSTNSVVIRGATSADGSSRTISSMKTLICLAFREHRAQLRSARKLEEGEADRGRYGVQPGQYQQMTQAQHLAAR